MSNAIYEWRQIPGGPKLATATVADAECAALSIYIPAGSRDEGELPSGLAHFVEHMVFKGTQRRSARQLSLEIEDAGGQINACTSEDHTVYEGRGEAELLPLLADVLSDMVWHASFPASEISLEREVIGEEIVMYRETPSDHVGDLISSALWSPDPLGNPIAGSLESIARIDRRALLDFRRRHHFRDDVVIAVAGPHSAGEVLAMLAPHLPESFHAGSRAGGFDWSRAAVRPVREERDTDQLQLALAWHTPGRHHPLRLALRLLSLILGETASSRLFLELREERGLCYQIGSDVSLFQDTGAFEISAGLDPDARGEALACIMREIDSMVAEGPRPGELERAKRLAISQSKLAFESTGAHVAWAGEGVMDYGEIPTPQEWRARVAAVTAEEVHRAACGIFSGRSPAMAEIGPE
jgi:predicted Zn-dependent peptidase